MNATINISLPKRMYEDVKIALKEERYTSISELIRDALRKRLYQNINENGFLKSFENKVLQASLEKEQKDVWESEEDIKKYFGKLRAKSQPRS